MGEYPDSPYSIVDGDLYHIDNSGVRVRVCHAGSAIALAFDVEDGVLHKHGEFNAVSRWYKNTKASLMKQESTAGLARALRLVSMPLEARWVAEMNRCIAVTGAVMGIADRISGHIGMPSGGVVRDDRPVSAHPL